MFVHKEKPINKSLAAIAKAKDGVCYRILPTGELHINNFFRSYVFLAYVRGNWFASHGMRKGSSMAIPEEGVDLFAYGNDSIWIRNEDNQVDVADSVLPLEESTHAVLFAFSGKAYDVIIADGSKCSAVVATKIKKTAENTSFLIMALTSMIRQYDEKAADDILKFWFRNNDSEMDASKETPMIDWEKNNTAKEEEAH